MSTNDTPPQLPVGGAGDEPASSPTTPWPGTAEMKPVVGTAPGRADRPRSRLRVGTVVWGLVIAAIGVGVVATAAGAVFDLQLALIALLAVAGVAMLGGSIAVTARHRRP